MELALIKKICFFFALILLVAIQVAHEEGVLKGWLKTLFALPIRLFKEVAAYVMSGFMLGVPVALLIVILFPIPDRFFPFMDRQTWQVALFMTFFFSWGVLICWALLDDAWVRSGKLGLPSTNARLLYVLDVCILGAPEPVPVQVPKKKRKTAR